MGFRRGRVYGRVKGKKYIYDKCPIYEFGSGESGRFF